MCDSSLDRLQPDFETSDNICAYWQKVSEVPDGMGGRKYESLSYLVKAALTLSHSNAIPERGFSVNNALLRKEKLALAENTIVAQRLVKDCGQIFESITNVPVTKDVITAARRAYVEYCVHLDEQKCQQAAELRRRAELENNKRIKAAKAEC